MNIVYSCIFTILVSLFCQVPLAATPDASVKNQMLREMASLKVNPDTGITQRFYSVLDYVLVANQQRMPSLHNMVSNLAAKLDISVPRILIYTGTDPDIRSMGAFALSLYHNFSYILIDQNVIKMLSAGELEALLAHELNHVSYNHNMLVTPLYLFGGILKWIPIIGRLHTKYLAAINAIFRFHEVQADLGAIEIIDDGHMLCNALDRLAVMHADDLAKVQKACESNPYVPYFLDHPPFEERKKYIATAVAGAAA